MIDIGERLRRAGLRDGFAIILKQHTDEGADEIDRLRNDYSILKRDYDALRAESNISDGLLADAKADNERLRAALQQIMGRYELEEEGWPAAEDMRDLARRALEPKP